MKKAIIFTLSVLITTFSYACAGDDKVIPYSELPKTAKQFIETHFADHTVATVTMDKEILSTSYDVYFSNGNNIEFDGNGIWKEIDCKRTQVPNAVVPSQILQYVTTNYPDTKIIEIDRDIRDYEVKLDSRLELKFDMQFNLIEIDY